MVQSQLRFRMNIVMRLLMLVLLFACADRRAAPGMESIRDSPAATGSMHPTAPDSDTVLTAFAQDTVRIVQADARRILLWTSVEAGEPVDRFRSGDLYEGVPAAQLLDLDQDGMPDLFVAWGYEEQVSAFFLRARSGSHPEFLYDADPGICRSSELSGEIRSGQLHIIEYHPGAVTTAACRDEGPLAECAQMYFVAWPVVLALNASGTAFVPDTGSSVAEYYAKIAVRYSSALEAMRKALAVDSRAVCGPEVIARMEAQRARALLLAGGGS